MGKRKTHEEFVEEMNSINSNIEIVGTYIRAKEKVLCKCKIDNHEWYAFSGNLLNGQGCPKCWTTALSKSKTKTHEDFIKEMDIKHPSIKVLGIYISNSTKIQCECKICNHTWCSTPNNLLSAGEGCPRCGMLKSTNKRTKTHVSFINDMEILHPEIDVLGKYTNAKNKVLCRCKECNHEWMGIPTNLLQGQGCPKCNKPKGENRIESYLIRNTIDYISQYTFDDLLGVNLGQLSYDFYLPKHNCLIEYQGGQHYNPIEFFGGIEKFHIQQEHDNRKREYAKTHNIKLLEIPYWDFENIEQILESRLLKQSA